MATPLSQRVDRPKKKRILRFLREREGKLVENPRKAMFIKGSKTSEISSQCLKDFCALKQPDAVAYQKKNKIRPFLDDSSLEFFSKKSDCSLMAFASHSKKRPHSMLIARFYDYHILDLLEFGIENYKPISDFKDVVQTKTGNKPCFIIRGNEFETSETHKKFSNMIVDFFRGRVVDNLSLSGLDHVICLTTGPQGVVYFRHYKIQMKKSGTSTPRIELAEIGPRFDVNFRRHKFASLDLMKQALRKPPQLKKKKEKNITHNVFNEQIGRIHMERQDLSQLVTARFKGLSKKRSNRDFDAEKTDEPSAKRSKTSDDA
eukprot:TRINITY_DN15301_c0_g1_i1.p1 TRINITY_DN15301_c0_g1~~TRINITY_DN15301_c0_g1_i1.p1  ORF type:complete len:317 (+),score=156.08 TRINITY_DN15301_c0_g1_i1:15-965(+)